MIGSHGCELQKYEAKVYSQNGEDGIIAEILRRTGTTGLAVELGAHCEYGNCYLLAERGWPTLFIERNLENLARLAHWVRGPHISYKLVHVTAENVNTAIPAETAFLSIDIDYNDYWIWKALQHRPDVVVIEYNLGDPPPRATVVEYNRDHCWDGSDYYGASLAAMENLAQSKGYAIVATDIAQCNAYFVRREFADRFEAANAASLWTPPRWSHRRSERRMTEVQS